MLTLIAFIRQVRGAALYAATLGFPDAYTIRNVPDESHVPNIDHTLLQSKSHSVDGIWKRAVKRGM